MKIKFLIITIIMLFPVALFAQYFNNMGVKLAYTTSNIYHDIINNFSSRRSGFNVALFLELGNYKYLALVTQIEYIQKGFVEEQDETNEIGELIQHVEANTRLDYLSIPIFLKLKYPKIKFVPYMILGPRFDYLLNKENGVYEFTKVNFKSQFADHFDKYVFGGSIGAGFNLLKIYRFNTFLEFRYNIDFSDSFSSIKEVTIKNNSYDFWLGIAF